MIIRNIYSDRIAVVQFSDSSSSSSRGDGVAVVIQLSLSSSTEGTKGTRACIKYSS